MDVQKVFASVDRHLPEIREIRRHLHRYPELSGEEWETSKLVRDRLRAAGVTLLDPFFKTDVVGFLKGKNPGKNFTARADMDALPILEKSDLPYRSARDGIMHACGHDGHTATLLGAALVLSEMTDAFNGSIRFVFQPGEENVMGRDFVNTGVLRDPKPDLAVALHGRPGEKVGALVAHAGYAWAAADFFTIRVSGKGGHGAWPERSIDPIVIAAEIVLALQTIVSRRFSTFEPVVLSVCQVHGGTAWNTIPDSVELSGTCRHFKDELGDQIAAEIRRAVEHVAAAHGGTAELVYEQPCAAVYNHPAEVARGRDIVKKYLGEEFWSERDIASMGGEDFGYFLRECPGALFSLGLGDRPELHHPGFDFNDDALRSGIAFFAFSALDFLNA